MTLGAGQRKFYLLRTIFHCLTKSVMNQKDIFPCKTLSGAKQTPYPSVLDFWKVEFEMFSKNQVGQTWFLVYFELDFYCLGIVCRYFQLYSWKTLSVAECFQLSDICSCQTLSVLRLYIIKLRHCPLWDISVVRHFLLPSSWTLFCCRKCYSARISLPLGMEDSIDGERTLFHFFISETKRDLD
jgi:hypothetical protein